MNILSCFAILSCIIGLYTGVSILLSKDCDKSEKTFGVLALVWSVFTIFMNIAAMKVFIVPTKTGSSVTLGPFCSPKP